MVLIAKNAMGMVVNLHTARSFRHNLILHHIEQNVRVSFCGTVVVSYVMTLYLNQVSCAVGRLNFW